jgi:hypothetical protein
MDQHNLHTLYQFPHVWKIKHDGRTIMFEAIRKRTRLRLSYCCGWPVLAFAFMAEEFA